MHVARRPPSFGEIRPDLYIPPALEAAVFRALEKNPDDRFPSMLEFKEHLEHIERTMAVKAAWRRDSGRKGRLRTNAAKPLDLARALANAKSQA